jgi:solute carrier family 25 (mitochondrial phosphate transporter), member 3
MVKFSAFENTVKAFYKHIFTNPKDSYSKSFQLLITFMSGYWAGIFCALVSHPADTMVSILNKRSSNAPIG